MVEEHEIEEIQRQILNLEEDVYLLQRKVEDLSAENARLRQQAFYRDISSEEKV